MTNKTHLDKTDMATIVLLIVIGWLGWSMKSEAGFYADAGVGMIRGLEYEAEASVDLGHGLALTYTAEAEYTLNDLPFFMLRGGYEYNGMHIELQTTGVPEYHYETLTVYYRWRW